jgi:hypothetical protein
MKRITQVSPKMVRVESVINWPKCDFCGSCHPADMERCPRNKCFDRNFNVRRV